MLDLRTRTVPLTFLILLLIVVLVSACSGTPTPTPTLAPPTPTATAEPEPTAPPEPTATAPRPTSTPRPSATAAARATGVPPRTVTPTVSGKPTAPPVVIGGSAPFARAGLNSQSITVLAVGGKEGQTLYAGGKGISRSTDGGKTWTVVREKKDAPNVAAIAIAPSNPQVVYVGISEGCAKGTPQPGLVSTDGGATWKEVGENITSIAIDPNNAQKVYVADCNGLERTTNGGLTWEIVAREEVDTFVPKLVALAPSAPQTIYLVGGTEGGVVKMQYTNDGGETWQDITPKGDLIGPLSLAIDPATPETIILSTVVGILRSPDSGQTWAMLNEGGLEVTIPANLPTSLPEGFRLTTALIADPDQSGLFWVGTGSGKMKGIGIFRTRDGGETWRRSSQGIEGRLIQALAIGGARNSRVLYAATDDGIWALTSP